MENFSLHPFSQDEAIAFVNLVRDGSSGPGGDARNLAALHARALTGDTRAVNALGFGFAQFLLTREHVYAYPGLSLSTWELRVDRGAGMYLRPPSRLFADAGLEPAIARAMPIRLDAAGGMMGGAFIPARLIPDYRRRLEKQLDRSVRRMVDLEMDAAPLMGLMLEAAQYAERAGVGLFEAAELIDVLDSSTWAAGAVVIAQPADREQQRRIVTAMKPPRSPGLFSKLIRGRRV